MNILIINHYAGSDRLGMEYRPFYLGREWVGDGHAVTVVGASFSHLRQTQPEVGADHEVSVEDGVRFRWLRTGPYQGNGAGRVANMLTFVGKLIAHAPRVAREERPDVVICSSTYPLDIYAGARIARLAGARLVFEVHDLWPLTPMLLGGYSPRHPYIRLLQAAEDYAYRNADLVVSILPDTCGYMESRGLDPSKFVYVPNGIPIAALQASGPDQLPPVLAARIARERERGHFLVGYAGGFNPSNAIDTILEAARLLAGLPVSFLLVGGGSTAREIRAKAERMGLDSVHLFGPIPKPLVPRFLSEMDTLAMPWHRSPLYRFGVSPNKMFDYMLAGRPIVQSCDASNDLVAEAQCGITVAPEDPAAYAEACLHLSRLAPSERARLGENGRRFVRQHHDYRLLASRFMDALGSA
ncbi:glycosyltransferase family 4 protein [Azospirillum doebereinerae]